MAYYLKCTYAQWNGPDEYIISFNAVPSDARNWCFVRKKDVIASNDREGLVRIVIYSEGVQDSLVGFLESYSYVMRKSLVPSSDIVKQ